MASIAETGTSSQIGGTAQLPSFQRRVPFHAGLHDGWDMQRVILWTAATVFLLVALALWVVPGSSLDSGAVLMKAGLTTGLLGSGMVLFRQGRGRWQPQVIFDPMRREMRVLMPARSGRPRTVLRRRYSTIGTVRLRSGSAEFLEADGSLLLKMPLVDCKARQTLHAHLMGAVPIQS